VAVGSQLPPEILGIRQPIATDHDVHVYPRNAADTAKIVFRRTNQKS